MVNEDEIDWSLTTWEGSHRAELRDAMSMSLIEKLNAVEEMCIWAEKMIAERRAKGLPYIDPDTGELVKPEITAPTMKSININHLSYDELLQLNRQIVARLKHLDEINDLMHVHEFNVGETVQFTDKAGRPIQGVVARLNKKSVSVITKDGSKWNVSPQLLAREREGIEEDKDSDKVIDIRSM